MKNVLLKTTLATAIALLVTGCGGGADSISSYGNSGTGTDTLAIAKTISPKGFVVLWDKKSSGYSEIIYTDDLSKERGNGYTATSNTKGFHKMTCEEVYTDVEEASYKCKPDNVTYTKRVNLKAGVEYKWLVNYSDGVNFTKGDVQAIMTYNDGELSIQK